MHHDEAGRTRGKRNGRQIPQRIERNFLQQRHHPQTAAVEEQRVAIGRRRHDDLGGDDTGRAVVDDYLLAEAGREPLGNESGDEVGRTADRRSDDAQRPGRELLRIRCTAERDSAGWENREQTTGHRAESQAVPATPMSRPFGSLSSRPPAGFGLDAIPRRSSSALTFACS